MILVALFLVPFLAAVASFFIRRDQARRFLLIAAVAVHLILTLVSLIGGTHVAFQGWLTLDVLGKIFLTTTSLLFFAAAIYAVEYLRTEENAGKKDFAENFIYSNSSEAVFTGCFLAFLSTMTLVMMAGHMGLLWIAMEATTLASAPLIYFHRHHRSLEATWKYLLICSVGIALALLGTLFLAVAYLHAGPRTLSLLIADLVQPQSQPNLLWLKAAFLFLFVGYGTKMGLAPLHTWLPDAHSEAPSIVSALLSGTLLNCAFLGILRVHQVCVASGLGGFSREIFILFGLLSMIVAALFIVRQTDYKRMLAYSSIEHMGILAVGVGLGGLGTFGALLHLINHSLSKGALFLTAGNILAVYKTKSVPDVRGMIARIPASGILWLAGFLSIAGSPPSGTFMSELVVVRAALQQGRIGVLIIFLATLLWVFMNMASIFMEMIFGEKTINISTGLADARLKESWRRIWPIGFLLMAVFLLGIIIPTALSKAIQQATWLLEVR